MLTIAIPTYNRHEYLLEQINRLIEQNNEAIEVIVIDNLSTPSVEDFFTEKINLPKNFTIIRNTKHVIIDENIYNCIKSATKDWVWTLSDGDYIVNDAVAKVLGTIKQHEDSFFIGMLGGNKVVENLNDYLKELKYWSVFAVSYCIFNMKFFAKYLGFYKSLLLTHQPQLFSIIKIFTDYDKIKLSLIKLYVFETSPLPGWSKGAFVLDTINTFPKFYELFPKEINIIKILFPKLLGNALVT